MFTDNSFVAVTQQTSHFFFGTATASTRAVFTVTHAAGGVFERIAKEAVAAITALDALPVEAGHGKFGTVTIDINTVFDAVTVAVVVDAVFIGVTAESARHVNSC